MVSRNHASNSHDPINSMTAETRRAMAELPPPAPYRDKQPSLIGDEALTQPESQLLD
jgi:hypothetical protein